MSSPTSREGQASGAPLESSRRGAARHGRANVDREGLHLGLCHRLHLCVQEAHAEAELVQEAELEEVARVEVEGAVALLVLDVRADVPPDDEVEPLALRRVVDQRAGREGSDLARPEDVPRKEDARDASVAEEEAPQLVLRLRERHRPLVVQQLQEGGEVHVQPDDTPDDGVDGDELRVRDVVAPEREAEQPVHDEEDVPGQNRDC